MKKETQEQRLENTFLAENNPKLIAVWHQIARAKCELNEAERMLSKLIEVNIHD